MEPRIGTARVAGQSLRYAFMGPEDASRTLLIFNGIGANLDLVAPIARHFTRTRLLIFDVPGVGGSPTPILPYRFSGVSRLAKRLLDHLGIDEIDVLGVSWGGAAAQQFVYDNQARCRSMILAATSAGMVMAPGAPKVLMKLATPRRYTDPEHMMKIGPQIYGGVLRGDTTLLRKHAHALRSGKRRGYLYQLLAGLGWTSWLWLPRIETPTLIMMGDDDPIVPAVNGRILRNRLPNAELVTMPCGHLFILTHPEQTAGQIEAFIHEGGARAARSEAERLAV